MTVLKGLLLFLFTTMDEILARIDALRKTNVYSGTIYEYDLLGYNILYLESLGYKVLRRNCSIYPTFISWK